MKQWQRKTVMATEAAPLTPARCQADFKCTHHKCNRCHDRGTCAVWSDWHSYEIEPCPECTPSEPMDG